jgi:hypothetical protein
MIGVMSKWLIVLILSMFSAQLVVAAARNWKSGTLVSIDERKELRSSKKNPVIEDRVWAYSVDAGDLVYEAERGSNRPIQIEINGPVSFVIDGAHFYLKDASGHEFKLTLLKTTRKKRVE